MRDLTYNENMGDLQGHSVSDTSLVRGRQEMRDMIGHATHSWQDARSGESDDPARAGDPGFQDNSRLR